jgi:flagellar basal body P-ring formation protein FlgA
MKRIAAFALAGLFCTGWAISAAAAGMLPVERAERLLQETMIIEQRVNGDFAMTMDGKSMRLVEPESGLADLRADNFAYDAARGRVTADLVLTGKDGETVRHSVGAKAVPMIEIPVAVRRIMAGEIVKADDIERVRMPRDRAMAAALEEADIIGKEAKRAIAPRQALQGRDLRQPVVLRKGSLVTLMLQGAGMTLTAQGKALDDAAKGELARIVNSSSGRVIEAEVAGPNLVLVHPVSTARS